MVSGKKRIDKSAGLKDGDANLLYDKEKIKDRWDCYCKALFKEKAGNVDRSEWESISSEQEPLVLKSEIRSAIKKMKCQKAVGLDDIPAEALKAGEETVVDVMKVINDRIWRTGDWPINWTI